MQDQADIQDLLAAYPDTLDVTFIARSSRRLRRRMTLPREVRVMA